eukprot:Blabericola_migrator_1__2830@NODE_180_length_11882_cov_134_948540_g18_i1_p3_GENE_NODE_180_length_11882_cov_134_948540_g18_i1NODE_180_length_11882_cov_134_948540_g18_i1_p3_ORF_typecomplete_len495_score77_71C2/PF00168_30/0_67C2/PF00168_30/0_084DUF2564/PF10819_8/0_051DUF2564/PF10819_8/1_8e03HAUS5/PF14817_6/0_39SOG2/PF10428_9/1_1DUF4795/PF16043_5/2_5DUF4795/PF16043_5/16Phage_HK97_TLTM/PF06120_11/3Phage_HK97_TLTM/PF06120_11/60DUF4446/PF14584_6/9_4e02DUF4446/PF14584_6/7_2e02DUF4446/PF14584_6/4_1Herpes
MKHIRVYVDKLIQLPSSASAPFVRVQVGDATPTNTRVGSYVAPGEYDISVSSFFEDRPNQDITIEVMDHKAGVPICGMRIPNWKSSVHGEKFKGWAMMQPIGRVRLDIRLFDVPTQFPNRLHIAVAHVTGLPDIVRNPYVKINVGEVELVSERAESRSMMSGHFEWNKTFTAPYRGDKTCIIGVLGGDGTPIGSCRFDIWECLHNRKDNFTKTGHITLIDSEDYPIGNIYVAFSLWDTKDAKTKAGPDLDKLELLKHRYGTDVKLLEACKAAVELTDVRPIAEAEHSLENAMTHLNKADETAISYDSPTMSKPELKGLKKQLRKAMLEVEAHLDHAEKYLQQICYSAAGKEWELGKVAKGQIHAAARDAALAREVDDKDPHLDQLVQQLSGMVDDAEDQETMLTERMNAIQLTPHTPSMLAFYEEACTARRNLEALAAKAKDIGAELNELVRQRRLAVRKQQSIKYNALGLSGAVLGKSAQSAPTFPMCCCCWI